MNRILPLRRRLVGAAALSLSAVLMAAPAVAEPEPASLVIPAAPLGDALRTFSTRTGVSVIFTEALVAGHASRGVRGAPDASAALAALLDGTGLEAVPAGGGFVIRRVAIVPAAGRAEQKDAAPARVTTPAEAGEEADLRIERVTVTGTSLRGIAPESSPLQIYTREDILKSGVTTTEQFIRTLPQNFGGGSTEQAPVGLPGDDDSANNRTFGSGANLRGLGSGATLTLLNGRRLAPTSRIGNFVDLSMIPVSALERVDVLTDGASSIYGGDAVGGVVNLVLRDDYDGAEAAFRYGTITGGGGMPEFRAGLTGGTSWDRGNVLGTYEYFSRDNLTLKDRPQITPPLLTNGNPIAETAWFDLLPRQERHSLILAANQSVTDALDVSAFGLHSSRRSRTHSVLGFTSSTVYEFEATSEFSALSLGADYRLSPDWNLALDATYSEIFNDDFSLTIAPRRGTPAMTQTWSDQWSGDVLLQGSAFALPAGTLELALGGHVRRETFLYQTNFTGVNREGVRDVMAVSGEVLVPLVSPEMYVPGVRRLELNASGRMDDYSDFGSSSNPKLGLLWSPVEGLNLRGTYSQSFVPPPLGRSGDQTRNATVYPFAYLLQAMGGLASPDPALVGTDYMFVNGTAADLDPETSEARTFGADYRYQSGGATWSAAASYYDIDFVGRLSSTPLPQNQNPAFAHFIAYDTPDALPDGTVIFFPTAEEIQRLVASFSRPISYTQGATNLDNIGIINNASVIRNLASTSTRGLDLQLAYSGDFDFGKVSAGLNANYILEFDQQAAVTTPAVDVRNSLRNPVDLRLRANAGFSRDGFSANVFANYVDAYWTDDTAARLPIDAWTTVDLSLSYDFGAHRSRLLDGTRLSLSVSNLFDEAPPETPPLGAARLAGYDPTNASPLMRFVAVEIRKAF